MLSMIQCTMRMSHFLFLDGSKLNEPYFSMHHTKLPAYLREQKKYHLAHHYKNFELGFGVTSMVFPSCHSTFL
jgi:sterol desaturase/sphingolipid hydroxylase (fatty acid hydroxylase superfamily)